MSLFKKIHNKLFKLKYCSIFDAEKYFNKPFDEKVLIEYCKCNSLEIRTNTTTYGNSIKEFPSRAWKNIYDININKIY